jgi:hypothetical protein
MLELSAENNGSADSSSWLVTPQPWKRIAGAGPGRSA